MRKITLLFAFAFLATAYSGYGQTTIYSQSFETDLTGYSHTPSQVPSADPGDQYFYRAIPSDPTIYEGSVGPYTNVTDAWLFVGSNPNTINGGSPGLLTFDQIIVTGYSNLEFHADFGAVPHDWDLSDDLRVEYQFDGGGWNTLYSFEAGGTYNFPIALIGNATGGINTANGTVLTYDLTTISSTNFVGSGNILDIRIVCDAGANYEAFGVDNIVVIGTAGGNNPPNILNINQTPSSDITSSSTVSVDADVTDLDGLVTLVELHWGTVSGVLGNTINMSNTGGDTYSTDTDIPAQADGTTVYYEIAATDDEPETTTTFEYNYQVIDPATTALPYSEDFAIGFGDCYAYNVAGSTNWTYYASGQIVQANGFGSSLEEEWLVLPGIDLDSYSNEVMTFNTKAKYGTNDANNYLKLMYSTDYFGIGDPTLATWTELTYNQPIGPIGTTELTTLSGNVDLSGITGTSVYIAFKYYSTDSPTRWGIDDIVIAETLSWYNLQWPGTQTQPSWWNTTVYAKCWEPGVTDAAGQGAGIECWIGYSSVDENPEVSANFSWVIANFLGDDGSNDQYSGDIGAAIPMAPGTYYYVTRWRFNNGPYTYGGFQNGAWNGTTNVSGILTIDPSAATSTWTGAVNDNWFDGGNWDSDVPGYNTDAIIPDGLSNYPLTTGGTAMCNNLLVQSNASGDASIIEYGNLNVIGTATVQKYLTADVYHSYSPSVAGLNSGLFHLPGSTGLDIFLYSHNEINNGDANGGYFEITDLVTGLNPMAGYAVWLNGSTATPPVTGWTFDQQGTLNSGAFGVADNMTRTGTGLFAGFNYVGNPYPSFIDWDALTGWDKTQMNGTIYTESNGNWAAWIAPGPGANGGSNIIAPGQGFFVEVNNAFTTGTLMMDNTVRSNTSTPYLKSTVGHYVKLAAIGNDKTDEMVVRFDENATALFDGQYDGAKLAAGDESYPQIYSVADRNLAYNALPETEMIQLGFTAGVDGEYMIQSVDNEDIPYVYLEDSFTGIFTDLTESSYSFNYSTSDDANRFVLHFSALAVAENAAGLFNIFAYGDEIIVSATDVEKSAQISVYNIMGQEVATTIFDGNVSKLKMDNNGVYVVKVVSQQGITSRKVSIK